MYGNMLGMGLRHVVAPKKKKTEGTIPSTLHFSSSEMEIWANEFIF